jgi:general secretion pathway protein N
MRLPFNVRYLVLGVLVYIAILVLTIPAARVYAYWQSSGQASPNSLNKRISLAGIEGSIWSGSAERAVILGQAVNQLEWSLHPWSLLLGEVGVSWRFQLPDSDGKPAYGQGTTDLGLGGSIDFPELKASIPINVVANMARLGALRPAGTLDLNLEDVKWDGQNLVSANGRIVWRNAEISMIKPISYGDLTVKLETSNHVIKGVISDSGGPLSAQGVATLTADGRYQFTGAFGSRGDQDLENALRAMGRPGPDGKVKVNYSGNLASLGILPRRRGK